MLGQADQKGDNRATMKFIINPDEIRKAISIMKPNGQLFEIRYISNSGKLNFSGYFKDIEILINKLQHLAPTEEGNVYITLNAVNPACYSRQQRDKFIRNCKNTTSDNDIDGYDWLLIDLDPKRPSGTSSSDKELEEAHIKAKLIYKYLRNKGWNEPVIAMSGNGYHLLYKIYLGNSREKTEIVKSALLSLNMLFGDENTVDVDVTVFNPSRICKLYGTMAAKGSDTEERPHRLSRIIYAPDEIKINDIELVKGLANELPEQDSTPQKYNNYNPQKFDLKNWLSSHGVEITQVSNYQGGKRFILKQCPFDSNHNGKDACVIQRENGAIGFKCFHQSCSRYGWKDFRRLYEPTVRASKEYHKPNRELPKVPERQKLIDDSENEPIKQEPLFFTVSDVENQKTPPEEFVKTGITVIDKKLRGLKKGYVSCLSGLRASGKSSVLSQLSLEAVQQDYRVALYSGELTAKNLIKWLYLQAAGRDNVYQSNYENYYTPMPEAKQKICNWLSDNLLIYNNNYSNDYNFIKDSLKQCFEKYRVDLIILDNLMTLDISGFDRDKYTAQSKFVRDLTMFAKEYNVHILFVAHPRKSQGFLRLDDVSGTNDIVNLVDNAFILHRVNADFKRLTKETLKWGNNNPLYEASNVIEICKDRDGGVQDEFIPLYFEFESKRLKNEPNEIKNYGTGENKIEQDLPF